jgi:hypothetical protein
MDGLGDDFDFAISLASVVALGYLPAAIAWWMRIMRSRGGRE